ncbi:MAG: hypothetical protein N4A64_02955 [Marinisporobacter sp.]|jgi:hypothetical protein|nr:hypothetical protein [Marinisporobacter sp.]
MIIKQIDDMQGCIFKHDIKNMPNRMLALTNEMSQLLKQNIPAKYMNTLLEVLEYIHMAMENKDYLLVADLLEFELKPLFKNIVGEVN